VRYSQPFGTPAPPLGQYPRFINGDPITGTEGSIVPGTALDEDQIEIINVIENVRALGLIGAPGPPSHSDLTQLWQAINAFFNKQYITTAITKTVYGAGADFSDLNAALMWLSNYIITPTGYVTFMCSPGKWNHTQTIELNHANIARVAIQGAAMNANPTGSGFSVTGYYSATDGINQAIYLRSCFQTELHFDGGCSGMVVLRGGCKLRYLLLTGDLTVSTGPPNIWGSWGIGSGLECYDRIQITGVFCWGFGKAGWYVFGGGSIYSDATLSNGACYCQTGCAGYGGFIQVSQSGNNIVFTSCNQCGFFCYSGYYSFGYMTVRGNGGGAGLGAMTLEAGCQVMCKGNFSSNNGTAVWVAGCCTWVGEQSFYAYNTVGGVISQGGGVLWCDDSTFAGNGGNSVQAGGCAYIEILRCSVDGPVAFGYGGVVAGP